MKCPKCDKNFSYRLIGTVYPGCKTSEDIDCPYCNYTCGSVMTSQFVESIKEDQESNIIKSPKDLITEQETEMMDNMTEGQLVEYLAENFNDY